jgi:hypothetical protein
MGWIKASGRCEKMDEELNLIEGLFASPSFPHSFIATVPLPSTPQKIIALLAIESLSHKELLIVSRPLGLPNILRETRNEKRA